MDDTQFADFSQAVRAANLSHESLMLLREIIKIGSGVVMTTAMLSERLHYYPGKIYKAMQSLRESGVISCCPAYVGNRTKGNRITVNYFFKAKENTVSEIIHDNKTLALLAELDKAKPKITMNAKGLLTHYLSNINNESEFVTNLPQELANLGWSASYYRKYKNELLDRGIIATATVSGRGIYIKVNFEWSSDPTKALNRLPDIVSHTQLSVFLSKDRFLSKMLKSKQLPNFDVNQNGIKFWKKQTLINFFKTLIIQKGTSPDA